MPYPNYHSARINSPDKYKDIRYAKDEFGDGIDVLYGIMSEDESEVQAIRFDKDKFTASEARSWLKEHDYSPMEFEEATDVEKASYVEFVKIDDDEHVVGGIVYSPNETDRQGDWTTPEEIKKAMYSFMEQSRVFKVMHQSPLKATILENFQAEAPTEKAGKTIPEGAWWMSLRITDDDVWQRVKAGELKGFSMSGRAKGRYNEPRA